MHRRHSIAGHFYLRLAPALLLLPVATRVAAISAIADDPSNVSDDDQDYYNKSGFSEMDVEFQSVVGAALVFLLLGAFAGAFVLYRSYRFIYITELESIPACLRLPLYTALIYTFFFVLNSVNFWHSIVENEPWSRTVCKPIAALLQAFYSMICYLYVSFAILTAIRVSTTRHIPLGTADWRLWIIIVIATLMTVLMQLGRYGPTMFWCSVEDSVDNVVLAAFFVLIPFCTLIFCIVQIRRRVAAQRREACTKRSDLRMDTIQYKYRDADKLLRYFMGFSVTMIPLFVYIIACMANYKSPWVYICYVLSVTSNVIFNAIVYIGNEGWLSMYDSGFQMQSSPTTLSLAHSVCAPTVSYSSAPFRQPSRISGMSASQPGSPTSDIMEEMFDDFEILPAPTQTIQIGSGNDASASTSTLSKVTSAAAATSTRTAPRTLEQSRSRSFENLVFPTHSLSRTARRWAARSPRRAATLPRLMTENLRASTHKASQTSTTAGLETVQIHGAGSTTETPPSPQSPQSAPLSTSPPPLPVPSSPPPPQPSLPPPPPAVTSIHVSQYSPTTLTKPLPAIPIIEPVNCTVTVHSDDTASANTESHSKVEKIDYAEKLDNMNETD